MTKPHKPNCYCVNCLQRRQKQSHEAKTALTSFKLGPCSCAICTAVSNGYARGGLISSTYRPNAAGQQLAQILNGINASWPINTNFTPGANRATEEFAGADFDLSLGEVYGLRVWKVDQYGRRDPQAISCR